MKDCLTARYGEEGARVAIVDNFSNDGSAEEIADWLMRGEAWKTRVF
ncbi:MAG: hypothetical protein R3C42_02455 [Parvularculaceae bacterium]